MAPGPSLNRPAAVLWLTTVALTLVATSTLVAGHSTLRGRAAATTGRPPFPTGISLPLAERGAQGHRGPARTRLAWQPPARGGRLVWQERHRVWGPHATGRHPAPGQWWPHVRGGDAHSGPGRQDPDSGEVGRTKTRRPLAVLEGWTTWIPGPHPGLAPPPWGRCHSMALVGGTLPHIVGGGTTTMRSLAKARRGGAAPSLVSRPPCPRACSHGKHKSPQQLSSVGKKCCCAFTLPQF
jgi:hypothetical protein